MSNPVKSVKEYQDLIVAAVNEMMLHHEMRVDSIRVNWAPYTIGSKAQSVQSLELDVHYDI